MNISKFCFFLSVLITLVACEQPNVKSHLSSSDIKLPAIEQGFVNQFHQAKTLIPDSLDNDRKEFLGDSLKNTIDQWLSNKTGLKAARWLGVVMNDTVGQSIDAGDKNVYNYTSLFLKSQTQPIPAMMQPVLLL